MVRAFVVSEPDIRTTRQSDNRTNNHFFLFGPEKPIGEPRFLLEESGNPFECHEKVLYRKTISLSARASPLRAFGFVLAMKV